MGQIDLRSLSLTHRILLGGGVVLFIVMFFKWQGVSTVFGTAGVSGWHGLNGVLLGLVTLALIVWEVLLLLGDQMAELRKKIPLAENLVTAALAAGVLVLAILKFLTANEFRRWPEWVGLGVALAIGYGGWLSYSARTESTPEAQITSP
jgi:hypothetical protein